MGICLLPDAVFRYGQQAEIPERRMLWSARNRKIFYIIDNSIGISKYRRL